MKSDRLKAGGFNPKYGNEFNSVTFYANVNGSDKPNGVTYGLYCFVEGSPTDPGATDFTCSAKGTDPSRDALTVNPGDLVTLHLQNRVRTAPSGVTVAWSVTLTPTP